MVWDKPERTDMTLHDVKNDTRSQGYCGPTVIATISGWPMTAVKEMIREVRGRPKDSAGRNQRIKGTSPTDVLNALHQIGYAYVGETRWDEKPVMERPTLTAWLKLPRNPNHYYLIVLGHGGRFQNGHWVVVNGRKFCDTYSGEPVFIRQAPHRRKRVRHAIELRKQPTIKKPPALWVKPKPKPDPDRKVRLEAKRLAAKIGAEIEGNMKESWVTVWPPSSIDNACKDTDDPETIDPWYGDHHADGWHEVLEMCEFWARVK